MAATQEGLPPGGRVTSLTAPIAVRLAETCYSSASVMTWRADAIVANVATPQEMLQVCLNHVSGVVVVHTQQTRWIAS